MLVIEACHLCRGLGTQSTQSIPNWKAYGASRQELQPTSAVGKQDLAEKRKKKDVVPYRIFSNQSYEETE